MIETMEDKKHAKVQENYYAYLLLLIPKKRLAIFFCEHYLNSFESPLSATRTIMPQCIKPQFKCLNS